MRHKGGGWLGGFESSGRCQRRQNEREVTVDCLFIPHSLSFKLAEGGDFSYGGVMRSSVWARKPPNLKGLQRPPFQAFHFVSALRQNLHDKLARTISRKQYILPFHTSGRRQIQGGREMATEGGIKRLTGGFASSLGALARLNTRCSF